MIVILALYLYNTSMMNRISTQAIIITAAIIIAAG
jgi:hypothetical protein